MTRTEINGVPGVPETALSDELLARLPENLAPAPWDVQCRGVVWHGRGGRAAREAFAPALRGSRARASIGGFVRYQTTPVGPYDEIFGLVASAGTVWMAIEPARQIASTPESSALPVFPVLPTRSPDVALRGVRIGIVPSAGHEPLPQGS